jgi:hypothetical protein
MLINGILNACELGKYSDIDFTPPQGARDAAKRALEVRGEKPPSQRGMTSVGIARARDLIAGKTLSPDTIRRMHSFFSRHEVDKKGEGWDDQGKGWQAWNGWGGDAGFSWVKKLIKQMDSRDEKLEEPASCPIATQDIKTNLANRQNAVDDANYGPANPNEPNEDYWKAKADEFQGDVATAKKMRCGNCAAFNQTNKLLGCIKKGIGEDANEVAVGGDLGYCEIFDFKCAAKRTCDAWIVGGPITDDKKKVTNFVAGRDCGQDEGGTFGPDNKCAVGYGRPKEKGGYTPVRPGGKIPSDYKRPTEESKKDSKKETKNKLIPANEWSKQVKKDFDKKMLFRKYTSEKFDQINKNPESEESKKLISVVMQQEPHKQKEDMFRGLKFKTEQESKDFINNLQNGVATNRTLTSFTPSKNVATEFAYDKKTNPVSVLMVLKKSNSLRDIQGVSLESNEKEFVLTHNKKLKMIGKAKIKKDVYGKGINQIIVEVEEF